MDELYIILFVVFFFLNIFNLLVILIFLMSFFFQATEELLWELFVQAGPVGKFLLPISIVPKQNTSVV